MKKRILSLIMGMAIAMSLAGCGSKEVTTTPEETIVETVGTTTEESTEASTEELGYVLESEKEEEEVKAEPIEFNEEYATRLFQDLIIFYQEEFLNYEGDEAEKAIRNELVECTLSVIPCFDPEIDKYGIVTADGIAMKFGNFDQKNENEWYRYKGRLIEKLFIEKFENGDESFMLKDFIANNNFDDVIKTVTDDNYGSKYTSIIRFYDLFILNEIADFKLVNMEVGPYEKLYDSEGNFAYYGLDVVSDTPDKDQIIVDADMRWVYFDENGKFMF